MNKYICIHGHFYQPPRENPWSGEIEDQKSAKPFRNWNERITKECYRSNANSKILGGEGKVIAVCNNYDKISFNFGPTLLSWLEKHSPRTYKSLLKADADSMQKFSGHGSAIAQAYNHIIMPLANNRDKWTQVIWGIQDFEYRFKRKPEGMWLPETAVDYKTLSILADHDIKFTILAPAQAARVKKIGAKSWHKIKENTLDTQRPYKCLLPNGKSIVIFFYDGFASSEVAFGGLLHNGEHFAKRLSGNFKDNRRKRLVHIATDGESYGHHHAFGNMALAYCLDYIEKNKLANITIYGEYLQKNAPQFQVKIHENTSWSCAHGVERWRSNCGCCIKYRKSWNQRWREGLREALDFLRDELITIYQREMERYFDYPWMVRDQYIQLVLKSSKRRELEFIDKHKIKHLAINENNKSKILKLLEMQKYAMLMYTSCGWFFDDIGGLEARQILQYAARAILSNA